MSAQGPRPKSVEALNAATRVYNDAVMAFGHEPDSLEWMRQQLREFSSVPLMLMISRPFGRTLEFFPELILNLCQGSASSIELARNLIRTLPKSEVERRVVADLESLVDGMNADGGPVVGSVNRVGLVGGGRPSGRLCSGPAKRRDAPVG